MVSDNNYLRLYLVLEPTLCGNGSIDAVLETVKIAINHGVSAVQLRFEEDPDKGEWYALAMALKSLLKRKNIPLIINDHIDIALAVDADGVHIGQSDLPVEVTRRLIGPDKILGLSVGNRIELNAVPTSLVDYVGIGPVFTTKTKGDASDALGVEQLKNLVQSTSLPVVAIGGITMDNLPSILSLPIAGISVVSAICGQQNIAAATAQLREMIDQSQKHTIT